MNIVVVIVKLFFNKYVDFIIIDWEEIVKKLFCNKLKIFNEKWSFLMFGIVIIKVLVIRGLFFVFKIVFIWNIKILKYIDLVFCMEEY